MLTQNRMHHILAVASKMKELAPQYGVDPEEAFALGFFHDIGYEIAEKQSEHARDGAMLLFRQGYKYWKEIAFHGMPQDTYDSPMLRLLNFADLTTGPNGENMTIEQRIEDIAVRYGKGSKQELDARKLASKLQTQGTSLDFFC